MKITKSMFQAALLGLTTLSVMLPSMLYAGDIKWNGFLNATANISDSKTPYLGKVDDNGSFDQTTYGFSGAAKINAKISVAGQLHMSIGGVEYDWGYAQYRFSENATGKAGRMKYPNGLVSEIFDIGTVNLWVRPPEAIYGDTVEMMFEGYNGAAFNYVTGDDVEFSSEFYIGEVDSGGDEHKRMLGVVLKAEGENFKIQLAGTTSTLLTANAALPENDKTRTLFSLGVEAQSEIVNVMFEYANSTIEDNSNLDIEGWYITLSHSMDAWTPHFTYQSSETVTGGPEQTSFTLGLNKQLDPSVVLKMEYQQVDPTNGGLFDAQPVESTVNFINLSMNLVF